MKPVDESPDDRDFRLLGVALSVCAARRADTASNPEALADASIGAIRGVRDGGNPDRPLTSVVGKTNRPN